MGFDFATAKKDGYSEDAISSFISQQFGFDYLSASRDGFGDDEISKFLDEVTPAPVSTPDTLVPAPIPENITGGGRLGSELGIPPPAVEPGFEALQAVQQEVESLKQGVGDLAASSIYDYEPDTRASPISAGGTLGDIRLERPPETPPVPFKSDPDSAAAILSAAAGAAGYTVAELLEFALLPTSKATVLGKGLSKVAAPIVNKLAPLVPAKIAAKYPGAGEKFVKQLGKHADTSAEKFAGFEALDPDAETPGDVLANIAGGYAAGGTLAVPFAGASAGLAAERALKAGTKAPVRPTDVADQPDFTQGKLPPSVPEGATLYANPLDPELIGNAIKPVVAAGRKALEALANNPEAQKVLRNAIGAGEDAIRRNVALPPEAAKTLQAFIPKSIIEPGKEFPKYAESINLERVNAEDDVKQILVEMSAEKKPVPWADTVKQAEELGWDAEKMVGSQDADAFAAKVDAARQLNINTLDALRQKMEEIPANADERSPAMVQEVFTAWTEAQKVNRVANKYASAAGRALNIHRRTVTPEAQAQKNIKAVMEQLTPEEVNKVVGRLKTIDWENTHEVNKMLTNLGKATTAEMIEEAWINSLLSSPLTHIKNIVGNTFTTLLKPFVQTGAAVYNAPMALLTGKPRERYFGEALHDIYGATSGLKDGVRKGLRAYIDELSMAEASKLEPGPRKAIPSKVFRAGKEKKKIGGVEIPLTGEIEVGGKQIRTPGRLLGAMDTFFKTVNHTAEIHTQAYRHAANEGLKGQARIDRIAELVDNPTEAGKSAADKEMLYRVFQNELGEFGKKVQGLVGVKFDALGGLRPLKFVAPFIKTPTNLAKFSLEHSLANAPRVLLKALKREEGFTGGELADEASKTTIGSIVSIAVYLYAKDGLITGGGPKDKNERAALYREGWKPYSLKVGDQYYSFRGLEPLSTMFGLAADMAELDENSEGFAGKAGSLVGSVAKNITSTSYSTGINNALNAITDPERHGERWVTGLLKTVVPRGVAAVARADDPYYRRPEGVVEAIAGDIPGFRKDIRTPRDIWGERVKADEGSFVEKILLPTRRSRATNDPIEDELARLEIFPGLPSKKFTDTLDGRGKVELTPQEYDNFVEASGKAARVEVEAVINERGYPNWDDDERISEIKKAFRLARREAKEDILDALPDNRFSEFK